MIRRTGKFYRKNEADVMAKLGLKPTFNSGSGWLEKEDGISEYVLSQLKSTDKNSIAVKLQDIYTLEHNADVAHKIPVFVLQFIQSNDIFVMVRPVDLPNLEEYLETGKTVIQSFDITPDELEQKPIKQIKSGNREAFWEEKLKERESWKKK